MAGKTEILRALEELPPESLKAVIGSLKKRNGKARAIGRNGSVLAKKQLSAIKKWAGTTPAHGSLWRCGMIRTWKPL